MDLLPGDTPQFDIDDRLRPAGRLWPFLAQVAFIYVLDLIVQMILSTLGFNEGEPEGRLHFFELAEPMVLLPLGCIFGCLAYQRFAYVRKTAGFIWLWFLAQIVPGFIEGFRGGASTLMLDAMALFAWPRWQTDGFVTVYLFTYPALLCLGYSFAASGAWRRIFKRF